VSKLVSGDAKITDLALVREAALQLGWDVLANVPVSYFSGEGPVCNVVISPNAGERDRYGKCVGKTVGGKYSIGFQRDAATGKVTMLHDNAMNGAEVYSVESGKMDDTTTRVVGKLRQAIADVQVQRILQRQRASWRVEQRDDGAKVYVVRR
jgi:hypothetical protein